DTQRPNDRNQTVHDELLPLRPEGTRILRKRAGRAPRRFGRWRGRSGQPFPGALPWELRDRQRLSEVEPLCEIDADALELREHGLRPAPRGDRGEPERPPHLADGLHHAAIDGVLRDVADELAVDLEKVYRQGLQVHEGRDTRAKVIEGELAAPPL